MRLERARRRRTPVAMTSLVDVVFILLFFFMLALRPPAAEQVSLQLAVPGQRPVAGRTIEVLGQGRLRQDGRELRIAQWSVPGNGATLLLRAGPAAQLQDLLDALDRARSLGFVPSLAP